MKSPHINLKREYFAWSAMKSRCYNPKNKAFKNYGGRGIKVCDRWLNSFENFFNDMGPRPSDLHSLDRFPDKNGDYEPSNCQWRLIEKQNINKRTNVWIEFNGIKMVLGDWAKLFNIHSTSLTKHLQKGRTIKEIQTLYAKNIIFNDPMPTLNSLSG